MGNNKSKALVKGTIIYAIGNFGTKIITFLIVPLYTYYISPEDLGEYDLIITTVSLFTPIITLRISDAAYRWMLKDLDSPKNCISATYRILILCTVLVPLIALCINFLIKIPFFSYFITILIFGRWLESLQTLLRGLKKQLQFAISGIIYAALFVSANFIKIVLFKEGVSALYQSTIISQIITIIVIFISTKELRTCIISDSDNRRLTKEFLKYSAPLVPSGLSWWIMSASDRYVIKAFLGSAANGIFAISSKFPAVISMLFTILNLSWTDVALSDLENNEESSNYFSTLFRNIYKFALSAIWVLVPATNILVYFIVSDIYLESSLYIGFLYLGAVFQGFTTFISAGLLKNAMTGSIAKSSLIGAAVNLIVDISTIRFIGLHAASLSTFLGFFVMWIIRLHDLKNTSTLSINIKELLVYLSIAIIIILWTIKCNIIMNLYILIITSVLFLLINKNYLVSLIRRIIRR